MKVYVTDDNFYQSWFLFKKDPEMDRLLQMHEELPCIYPYEEDGLIYPAVLISHVDALCQPYTWTDEPFIVFSTIGILNEIPEMRNNHSRFTSDGKRGFFNAKIWLNDVNEINVRVNDLRIGDLLILAKSRWCSDMGLNYINDDTARDIQLKLNSTEEFLKMEIEESEYMKLLNKYRKMPYTDYLRTEHWRHFRNEAIKFFGGKCALCPKKDLPSYQMHLHHRVYENIGRETFNDVIILCDTCHQKHHNIPLPSP